QARMIGHEVLDAREQPAAGIADAPLVVAHPPAGHLRPAGDLVGPAPEVLHLRRAEEAAQREPAVPRPVVLRRRVEHALVPAPRTRPLLPRTRATRGRRPSPCRA